jgi:hypothetical protein
VRAGRSGVGALEPLGGFDEPLDCARLEYAYPVVILATMRD